MDASSRANFVYYSQSLMNEISYLNDEIDKLKEHISTIEKRHQALENDIERRIKKLEQSNAHKKS